MSSYDAIVVGGGVSGLVAARDLAAAGRRVLLLEGASDLGGSVACGLVGSVSAELGADAFAHARPEVATLAGELGISRDIVTPQIYQAYLRRDGVNVALPASLMGIPVRYTDIHHLLGAEVAATAEALDSVPLPDELPASFGKLLRLRLGDTVVDQMVDPVVSGVHASRADTVETVSIVPGFDAALRRHGRVVAAAAALRGTLGPAGAPVSGLREGMSQLVRALVADLNDRNVTIMAGEPVTAVAHAADGWQVTTPQDTFHTDRVIVALPAAAAAAVLSSDSPQCAALVGLLDAFMTTDVALVALHVVIDGLADTDAPLGSGVLIAPGQADVKAKALTHVSAKWADVRRNIPAGTHLFRLSYGGTEPLPVGSDDDLIRQAITDLARLLDVPTAAIETRAARVIPWRGALTRPTVGRMATVDALDRQLANVQGLALVGNAYSGNGLAGVVGRARREVSRILNS